MERILLYRVIAILLLAPCATAVAADDRAAYNQRAATEDAQLFAKLDRNADNLLTRDEASGDLNLGPRFDDMDINRDGVVTQQELKRYLEMRYGPPVSTGAAR